MSSKKAHLAHKRDRRNLRTTSNIFSAFTQQEIQEFKEAFNMIDQNHDGYIDHDDLVEMLTSLGTQHVKEDEVAKMLNDAAGPVNFTMFLAMFSERLRSTDPGKVLLNAFRMFDDKDTGFVSEARLRHLLTSFCNRWTQEMVDDLLSSPRLVDSRGFNYVEFVRRIKGYVAMDDEEEQKRLEQKLLENDDSYVPTRRWSFKMLTTEDSIQPNNVEVPSFYERKRQCSVDRDNQEENVTEDKAPRKVPVVGQCRWSSEASRQTAQDAEAHPDRKVPVKRASEEPPRKPPPTAPKPWREGSTSSSTKLKTAAMRQNFFSQSSTSDDTKLPPLERLDDGLLSPKSIAITLEDKSETRQVPSETKTIEDDVFEETSKPKAATTRNNFGMRRKSAQPTVSPSRIPNNRIPAAPSRDDSTLPPIRIEAKFGNLARREGPASKTIMDVSPRLVASTQPLASSKSTPWRPETHHAKAPETETLDTSVLLVQQNPVSRQVPPFGYRRVSNSSPLTKSATSLSSPDDNKLSVASIVLSSKGSGNNLVAPESPPGNTVTLPRIRSIDMGRGEPGTRTMSTSLVTMPSRSLPKASQNRPEL